MTSQNPASPPAHGKPTAAEQSAIQSTSVNLETDNYIETYQIIAEWIRFADAKAAAVLTVDGALIGLLVPTLKPWLEADHPGLPGFWEPMVIGFFGSWLFLVALSSIWAFRCILPFRRRGKHPSLDFCTHFHPAAVCSKYTLDDLARFATDCDAMGMEGLKREVQAAVLIDSHISGTKYLRVTTAIRFIAWSLVFGFLYLAAIQF